LRAAQITQKNKSNSGSNNNDYNPSDENINNDNREQVSEENPTDQQEEALTVIMHIVNISKMILIKWIYLLHNSIICEGGPECSYLFNDRRLCFFHDKIRK
jgi:hypothetical protein